MSQSNQAEAEIPHENLQYLHWLQAHGWIAVLMPHDRPAKGVAILNLEPGNQEFLMVKFAEKFAEEEG